MRVLITFGGYTPVPQGKIEVPTARAGAELMAICTAAALGRRGHSIVLLTDGRPPVIDRPLPVVTRSDADPLDLPWAPDLVHAFDLARPTTVRRGRDLARHFGVPFALTPSSARQVWPEAAFGDEACAAADRVFVLTPTEIDDLALPDPSRARQIGQGPSLADSPDPAAFRRRLPGDGPVVLFLGRRSRLKGIDVLLLAAPLVWRAVPEAIFAVGGPSPGSDGSIAVINDPRIVDLGEVDLRTKTDAIAGCTMLCLPSRADVFPLVFVEAWTLGRPVVSGNFRGATDVVRNGIDGLVCEVRPETLAEMVIALLTDPHKCEQLGAAGRERAVRDLTWEGVAATVEFGYQELTGDGQALR